jgi:ATP-dependent RNA helicase DDX3X
VGIFSNVLSIDIFYPSCVYGGAGVMGQLREMEKGCDVLVAAPGRLIDFIDRGKIDLSNLKYLVLDEADRMLDMGFEQTIREIVERKGMAQDRCTLMYSATFPREIRALARDFLKPNYLFLKVGRVGGTTTAITQKIMWVDEHEKRDKLKEILMSQPPCRTLIFVDTKRAADT